MTSRIIEGSLVVQSGLLSALGLAVLIVPSVARADHNGLHSTPCNATEMVGGGQLGNSPGPVGPPDSLGWDVGSGQCNGSFTVTHDSAFPSAGGDGIELGIRAEQRRVGQVTNNTGDYEVQTGPDTTPPPALNRAWWNFQHSIAYDGDIDDLDGLVFAIRTDAGSSVPAPPADMLAIRIAIDDRNNQPNPTATYSDLYQASQNPLFGWLTDGAAGPYNINDNGAWTLTLAAIEGGHLADVSICIHTPAESCDAPPVVYTCGGGNAASFFPPANKAIAVKRPGRVIPLKMVCADSAGDELDDGDIAAPIVAVSQVPGGPLPGPFEGTGQGTAAGEFVFHGSGWQFNLDTSDLPGPGTYEISVTPGDGDLLLGPPIVVVIIG
jgi:hypothetical protein